MIGISNQSESVIANFIADQGIDFPVLSDRFSTSENYQNVHWKYELADGLSPYPRDFIIDQEGYIQFASTEYDPGTMITVIEELLGSPVNENRPTVTARPVEPLLVSAYPNPFNATTTIVFHLFLSRQTTLSIYDLAGAEVRRLVWAPLQVGKHEIEWDGRDTAGRALPTGLYIASLQSGGNSAEAKLVLLK